MALKQVLSVVCAAFFVTWLGWAVIGLILNLAWHFYALGTVGSLASLAILATVFLYFTRKTKR